MTAYELITEWVASNWGILVATLPGWISLVWLLVRERPNVQVEIEDAYYEEPSLKTLGHVDLLLEIRNEGNKSTSLRGAALIVQGPRGKVQLHHDKEWEYGIRPGETDTIYTSLPPGNVTTRRLKFYSQENLKPGKAKLVLTFTSAKKVKRFDMPEAESPEVV